MVLINDAVIAADVASKTCDGCGSSVINHQCGATYIVGNSYRRAMGATVVINGAVPIATECADCGGPLHYKYSKNETRFACSWRQYESDRGNTGFPWTPKTPSIAFNENTVMDYANWLLANPDAGKKAMHSGDAKKQQATAQAAWNAANGVSTPVVAKPKTPAQMQAAGIAAPVATPNLPGQGALSPANMAAARAAVSTPVVPAAPVATEVKAEEKPTETTGKRKLTKEERQAAMKAAGL